MEAIPAKGEPVKRHGAQGRRDSSQPGVSGLHCERGGRKRSEDRKGWEGL